LPAHFWQMGHISCLHFLAQHYDLFPYLLSCIM
jgi:hypothetical protein